MMERGGSFVKELGAAWYVADPINKAKLCLTFEHYFVKYGASNGASIQTYEEKFPQLIQAIASDAQVILVAMPEALGDTYAELTESLKRIYNAGKRLDIVPEKE